MNIRLASIDDIAACNAFHNAAYGTTRTAAQWRWEFASPLLPDDILPYALVEDNGRVVGTQALIPIRMIDCDGVHWTAKSEETLVDSGYRGQRLFERMYDLLLDYARRHGIRNIWGFTPATKAFSRLGFQIPGDTQQLLFPFRGEAGSMLVERKLEGSGRLTKLGIGLAAAAAARYSSLRSFSASRAARAWGSSHDVVLRTLEKPPAVSADFSRRFIAQWDGTTIFRDEAYLQWRLFDNPYVRSLMRAAFSGETLIGWAAWAVGDDGMGYLVDLQTACGRDDSAYDRHVARLLLSDGVAQLRTIGVSGIRGWRFNNHAFDLMAARAAKDVGFYHFRRGNSVVILHLGTPSPDRPADWFDSWFVSRIYTEGLVG